MQSVNGFNQTAGEDRVLNRQGQFHFGRNFILSHEFAGMHTIIKAGRMRRFPLSRAAYPMVFELWCWRWEVLRSKGARLGTAGAVGLVRGCSSHLLMAATVGASKRSRKLTSASWSLPSREISCVAVSEWPPSSKKLS